MMYTTKSLLLQLIFQFCILLLVSDRTWTDAELLRAGHERNDNNAEGLLSWLTSFGRDVQVMFEEEEAEEAQVIFEEEEKKIFEEEVKAEDEVAVDGDAVQYEVYGRDGKIEDILTEKEMEEYIKENNIDEKEAALLRGETVLTEEELEKYIEESNINEKDAEILRALRPYAYGYRSYRGWGYGGYGGYGWGYGPNYGYGAARYGNAGVAYAYGPNGYVYGYGRRSPGYGAGYGAGYGYYGGYYGGYYW